MMNPVLIAQIIQAALALAQAGTQVYTFLSSVSDRLRAAQAAGTDLTDADWAFIDQIASQNLAQAKGYGSVTQALLAAPVSAPATATNAAAG